MRDSSDSSDGFAGILESRSDPEQRKILQAFAVWQLLRRLRQRLSSPGRPAGIAGHTSPREYDNVRRHVLAVVGLMELLDAGGLTLATLGQGQLDRWVADHQFTYPKETAHFIRWALARRHARGLQVTRESHRSGANITHGSKRFNDARRLLHDDGLCLSDRVAGLLVLLYAQSLADVASLTVSHVRVDGTGAVKITLGTVPVDLPDPMATLVRELVNTGSGYAAIGKPAIEQWLFPGGRPGHPLDGKRPGERLRNIGLHPRHDRATALFTLAAEVPAGILARMLGISVPVAAEWQRASAGDWMTYAAEVSRRGSR